jgi:hypothetical protein
MPVSSNSRQCGQVIEPYSTNFTLALELPIMNPPAGVAATTCDQSPPAGGLTACAGAPAVVAAESLPFSALQAPLANMAAAATRM